MDTQYGPPAPSPHAVIAVALAEIAAAFPTLTFADLRQAEEAQRYVAQGLQAIHYHLALAMPPRRLPLTEE